MLKRVALCKNKLLTLQDINMQFQSCLVEILTLPHPSCTTKKRALPNNRATAELYRTLNELSTWIEIFAIYNDLKCQFKNMYKILVKVE